MTAAARQMDAETALKVLLVEDSPVLADRLIELLDQIPAAMLVAHVDNESDAVAHLRRQAVDVVILDLQLKMGTGFGVLKAMAAVPGMAGPRPHVLVLTNYDLPEYRRQATQLGADFFLDKAREYYRLPDILEGLRSLR